MNIEKNGWVLTRKDGTPVQVGEAIDTHHGNPLVIRGGTPPHKPSSTGRVHGDGWEYYPTVFDLVWEKQ
jgi:hypothetical protein